MFVNIWFVWQECDTTTVQKNSIEFGKQLPFSFLLVCYTTKTDTPGGVSLRQKRPPGRGVPTAETDTPGGVSLRGRDSVELPKRNPNRIRGFDYSQNGAYFVTICTQNRQRIFSKQAENFFKTGREFFQRS